MSGPGQPAVPAELSCAEVMDLAGLYVLDALEPAERRAVDAHLATCSEAHDEIRALGGVVPALATTAEPVEAPAQLKGRVIAAVQREAAAHQAEQGSAVEPWRIDTGMASSTGRAAPRSWSPPAWASWAAAVSVVVVIALLGVWAVGLQSRVDEANRRAGVLASAIEAFASPGSATAVLRGSGARSGASGFAAFTPDGKGYVVMSGLTPAPQGRSYQAWYIDEGGPRSAGIVDVGTDGFAILTDGQPLSGVDVVAFTEEPLGGSDQPTTDPFAVGEVQPPAS